MSAPRQGHMRPLDPRLTPQETQRKAAMSNEIEEELAALPLMTTNELCDRYQELFGQPVRTRHKAYLVRKIAWRVQALAEGDLSERARRRAEELANDADVRLMPPRPPRHHAGAGDGAVGATSRRWRPGCKTT